LSGSTKALVVEDDPRIVDVVEVTLVSLGHQHQWVSNLRDARKALAAESFTYALLDLEFPAKGNGRPSKENGAILLEEIQRRGTCLPVIVMTGHLDYALNRATELRAKGSWGFIAKPFPTESHTLACVIRKVLKDKARKTVKAASGITSTFLGGELVFLPERIELDGIRIAGDRGSGLTVGLLRELRRTRGGRSTALSAEELANSLAAADVTTITGCVRHLRRGIAARFKKQRNVMVGSQDVIARDERGYRLREWIQVRDAEIVPETIEIPPLGTSMRDSTDPGQISAGTSATDNERQNWVLEQVSEGISVRRSMLEAKFGISDKTAKRDLAELSRRGEIEYVRVGKEGYYRRAAR
jgi:DNA-binding response OmpR family regulator